MVSAVSENVVVLCGLPSVPTTCSPGQVTATFTASSTGSRSGSWADGPS